MNGGGTLALRGAAAVLVLGAVAAVVVAVAARVFGPPGDFFGPGSQTVTFRDGSVAHVFLSPDEKWRVPVRLSDVDPRYIEALIRLEDKRFYHHPGVDVLAVARALVKNVQRGRVVSGASTLTMQLVRVREPRPRTVRSKLVEAFRALQLEVRYDKRTLLEAYLTYIPFGRNIEGVQAAALAYFGHGANALSSDEIATLLAVPQNPNRRVPSPNNRARLTRARDRIAARLADWGVGRIGAPAESVAASAVPGRLVPFPRLAPHAAFWFRAQYPGQARIDTTLDRGVQRTAERLMASAAPGLLRRGIHNGAAVVVDHHRAEVRALVGNFDFWDAEHGGQIAGFARPRSPGSTLKPLLYALAIDAGRVLPEHLVLDVPMRFGSYRPKNYDGRFDGLVRLEGALSRSLNVPFVHLLAEIGVERFIGHLSSWGVESLVDTPGHYGLSAAIGGLEVTPLELAGLYTILAAEGRYRAPVWRPGRRTAGFERALSEGAVFLTGRALAKKDRPDFPSRRRFTQIPPRIRWKTGTSYGHRDAWAVGYDTAYTVAVWTGNFNNASSRALVGAEAAAPILFDLLEGFARGGSGPGRERPPDDLSRIEVCAYSGHVPTAACPHRTGAWARTARVPTTPCPYHVHADIDVASGLVLSPECRSRFAYETRAFLRWPGRLERWLSDEHRRGPSSPSFHPACRAMSKRGPSMVSPEAGARALLIAGLPATSQEIPLVADGGAGRLSWFVDGEFVGTAHARDRLWWTPKEGRHLVVVTDERGRSARRILRVERLFP